MALPVVVIIGRPNVGKSSLLNALARQRISIVDARAGVTRDRVSAIVEHDQRYFEVVDTGGVGIVDDDQLDAHVEEQIRYAIARADAAVFLVDVRDGLTPLDRTVADLLRRLEKPVILAVNKVDDERHEPDAHQFARLGYGEPLCISATHGRGRRALLERLVELLGSSAEAAPGDAVSHGLGVLLFGIVGVVLFLI